MNIESLVRKAQDGNQQALEGVIVAVQDDIFYLSLRMLCNPEDAKEATQEIIIKLITKLSTFEFNSKFKTWVYRVSTNYLLNEKKVLKKDLGLNFDMYKKDLESDLQDPIDYKNSLDYPLMLNEVRIACTMAMLLCLDHKHRITYILGEILELDSNESANILGIQSDSFRKQLSRSRKKVLEFTQTSCGLVNDCASCTCEKKLTGAINRGRVLPNNLMLAKSFDKTYEETLKTIKAISEIKTNLRTKQAQIEVPVLKGVLGKFINL